MTLQQAMTSGRRFSIPSAVHGWKSVWTGPEVRYRNGGSMELISHCSCGLPGSEVFKLHFGLENVHACTPTPDVAASDQWFLEKTEDEFEGEAEDILRKVMEGARVPA